MEQTNKRNTLALISIMLGAFISLLDTTIVNVALPDITTALHATSETIEWVISGYALAFGLVLILAGRLGINLAEKISTLWDYAISNYECDSWFCRFRK